ncbi:CGNR zinc finger domain-containing protein [Kitasatospora sp. NPDC056446]|uniref:CGNR zinc finger domain-containing protein n=1 Tax=Kitasatospora sp. NPDC056446 TaxID=3345819 RepID=UPI00367F9EBE
MPWPATARYDLEAAPGSLGLVQDLLNTISAGSPREPDLLGNVEAAQRWVDEATARWSEGVGQAVPEIVLDADSLAEVRAFRDDLQALIGSEPGAAQDAGAAVSVLYTATAALQLGEDGLVRLEPRGTGWRRLASLVVAAAFEGQRADTRRRLKTCRNPRCKVAFFDRSRNNSGVWHDVKTCGNTANLRAYRARRRAGGH